MNRLPNFIILFVDVVRIYDIMNTVLQFELLDCVLLNGADYIRLRMCTMIMQISINCIFSLFYCPNLAGTFALGGSLIDCITLW